MEKNSLEKLEKLAEKATEWIGSIPSLIVHSFLFLACFLLYFIGVNLQIILLVLTTVVSLEAIYLAIFIQMSVNKSQRHIKKHGKDLARLKAISKKNAGKRNSNDN
jgi:hypothetical protein